MPHEENFFRADWLSLGKSGVSCGHGRLLCVWGRLRGCIVSSGIGTYVCWDFWGLSCLESEKQGEYVYDAGHEADG